MKKIFFAAALACICSLGFGQVKKTPTSPIKNPGLDSMKMKQSAAKKTTTAAATTTTTKTVDKYHDNVDDRMKGPKGEKVYIGPNGGRYYLNASGNKVYVPYAGNKKPVAKP